MTRSGVGAAVKFTSDVFRDGPDYAVAKTIAGHVTDYARTPKTSHVSSLPVTSNAPSPPDRPGVPGTDELPLPRVDLSPKIDRSLPIESSGFTL